MEFNEIDEFDMNLAIVFFGRIKDLKILKCEINEISDKLGIKIRYQDINRGRLTIRREVDYEPKN